MSWVYVGVTLVLTVYGQLIVKWQVGEAGAFPAGAGAKIEFLARLLLNPWVMSVLVAAFIAALAWMAAMTRLELSRAYPVMSLSFVLVLFGSAAFLGESVTFAKVAGIVLILAGLIVGSQA